jgi:hypothetical protein
MKIINFILITTILLIFSSFSSQNEQQFKGIDKNAFRMSFGKRTQKTLISPLDWSSIDRNSFRMSFGKRSYLFDNNYEKFKQKNVNFIFKIKKYFSG